MGHGKNEEKGEFGNPWSGFTRLKGGTPIMLGPYVLAFPHKLFKCLLPKPKTLCTLFFRLLFPNSSPYKSTLNLFLKQTNNPKPYKSKCCIIKKNSKLYFKNYAHQRCRTLVKLIKTNQDLS
jgi:hypothetical protein